MSRPGLRQSLKAAPLPFAAAIALIAAVLAAILPLIMIGTTIVFDTPLPGAFGRTGIDVDPVRLGILAPVLLAGAASCLAAIDIGSRMAEKAGLIALIVATCLAILARDAYVEAFFALLALLVACRVRAAECFALAAIPAIVLGFAAGALPAMPPALVIVGGLAALAAGWWAATTNDLAKLARAIALGFTGAGLVAVGLGEGRAVGLCAGANALIAPLPAIAAALVFEATGTRSLDWLGGLARGMSRFSLLLLAGFGFTACLPPGPGFVAFVAVLRGAVDGSPFGAVGALALAGWFALTGFAAIRAFGAICLGRPRSLRAAAAEDAPRATVAAMALLVAGGAILALTRLPGTVAPVLIVLVAISVLVRRFAVRSGPLDVARFEDGFAKPPSWLPFGDPATQITATGFAAGMRAAAPARVARLNGVLNGIRAWLRAGLLP